MKNIKLHTGAQEDLKSGIEWYDAQLDDSGKIFKKAIKDTILKSKKNQVGISMKKNRSRRHMSQGFPIKYYSQKNPRWSLFGLLPICIENQNSGKKGLANKSINTDLTWLAVKSEEPRKPS